MGKRDTRIDAYILCSAEFARPILEHLRDLVHKACPAIEETVKWGFPHFEYKGIVCSMASFKQHCAFGFWKQSMMPDPYGIMSGHEKPSAGSLGRLMRAEDLPSNKIIIQYIKEAVRLNNENVKLPSPAKPRKEQNLEVPPYFAQAINKNKSALAVFKAFSHSNKKDYVNWVMEAKTESTRHKRMVTALEWIAEGKTRNWKYQK